MPFFSHKEMKTLYKTKQKTIGTFFVAGQYFAMALKIGAPMQGCKKFIFYL